MFSGPVASPVECEIVKPMAEGQNKAAAQNQGISSDKGRLSDKNLARRDRQTQALRQNLVRRKAQMRHRTKGDVPHNPAEAAKDEPSQG